MMSDNLFDMLEYAALGTEWREWLKEMEKAADLVDLRRADTLPEQMRIKDNLS